MLPAVWPAHGAPHSNGKRDMVHLRQRHLPELPIRLANPTKAARRILMLRQRAPVARLQRPQPSEQLEAFVRDCARRARAASKAALAKAESEAICLRVSQNPPQRRVPQERQKDSALLMLDALAVATTSPSSAARLLAISTLLSLSDSEASTPTVTNPDWLAAVQRLAEQGALGPAHDPLFRWPRAQVRFNACTALCSALSERDPDDFARRWLVRQGAVTTLASAAMASTSCPLLFQLRFARTDARLKISLLADFFPTVITEEELRRAVAGPAREPVRAWLRQELGRRSGERASEAAADEVLWTCDCVQRDSDRPLEERLAATRIAALEARARRALRPIRVRWRSPRQLPRLGEESEERDEEEVEGEAGGDGGAAGAAASKAREESSAEERLNMKEVASVLDCMVRRVEGQTYAADIVLEDVLALAVMPAIEALLATEALDATRRAEVLGMAAEDALASDWRDWQLRALQAERAGMEAEDRTAVRKRVKQLPPGERRAFLLNEQEYQRRCAQRVAARQKRIEWDVMLAEDKMPSKPDVAESGPSATSHFEGADCAVSKEYEYGVPTHEASHSTYTYQEAASQEYGYQGDSEQAAYCDYSVDEQQESWQAQGAAQGAAQGVQEQVAEYPTEVQGGQHWHEQEQEQEQGWGQQWQAHETAEEVQSPQWQGQVHPDWQEYTDENGYPYYYNANTGASQYEPPV